ncbi:c-type cytochrome [Pseudochrobactrum sp. HB0163]|uniref:c-type cytochrome n=1 Tax=Pseudochrobactrum sp. HB0163 TaxID=3450708 RepID=UPI003F6DBB41
MHIAFKNLIGLALLSGFALIQPALIQPAHAEGDAEKGKKVFAKCMACHTIEEKKNRVGPHLVNIIGRKTATAEGFKYSPAMSKAGEEGMVWDEETLRSYLAAPKQFIPGNKMIFAGLKKPEDISDLIAYLRSKSAE